MVCSIWLASTTTGSFSKNEPASCMRCCSAAVSWAASWLCSTTRTAYSVALLKSSASWSFRLEEDSLTCLFANKKLQIGRVAPFLFLLCPVVLERDGAVYDGLLHCGRFTVGNEISKDRKRVV